MKRTPDSFNKTRFLESQSWLLVATVLTLILFANRIHAVWTDWGLFNLIGLDYAIYGATAHVVTDQGWTHFHDLEAITGKTVQYFLPYYKMPHYYSQTPITAASGPSPYPAIFILPFLVTNLLGPVGGFAAWTIFNIVTVLVIIRGMSRGSERPGLVMYLLPFVYLPLSLNLFFGQLVIVITFGLYRSYSSFQQGREFRAGLWLGLLLFKPQFALVPAIILLGKRRWQALGGLLISGVVLAVSTVALIGGAGVRNYFDLLRSFSGFRRVPAVVTPQHMINFRGLLVNLLPEGCGENLGTILVLALSAAMTLSLVVVWRGRWDPSADRFPRQMLATLIVAMFTAFHSHIHGATLLMVPILTVITGQRKPGPLQDLLLLMFFLPMYVWLVTDLPCYSAMALMGGMACSYGVILAELCEESRKRRLHQSDREDGHPVINGSPQQS